MTKNNYSLIKYSQFWPIYIPSQFYLDNSPDEDIKSNIETRRLLWENKNKIKNIWKYNSIPVVCSCWCFNVDYIYYLSAPCILWIQLVNNCVSIPTKEKENNTIVTICWVVVFKLYFTTTPVYLKDPDWVLEGPWLKRTENHLYIGYRPQTYKRILIYNWVTP